MPEDQSPAREETEIFARNLVEVTKPNLEISINAALPASKSKIKVGDTILQGVEKCDIHIDANHEVMFATLRVVIGKLHLE